MKYKKVEIETTSEGIDTVCDILYGIGLYALEIADKDEFDELLSQAVEGWDFVNDKTSVTVYLTDDIEDTINSINELFKGYKIHITELDDEDYADNWKQYFKPLPVGEKILILPVWETLPEEYSGKIVFKIEPGMSFGTGTHETTQLCIEALERYIRPGCRILDIGCGSGILFTIGLLLGAESAVAADIDSNSVRIAAENAALNEVDSGRYTVLRGDIVTDAGLRAEITARKYDVILINIVAEVIINMLPVIKAVMNDDTTLILSGIINTSTQSVRNELDRLGFTVVEHLKNNDWDALCVRL